MPDVEPLAVFQFPGPDPDPNSDLCNDLEAASAIYNRGLGEGGRCGVLGNN